MKRAALAALAAAAVAGCGTVSTTAVQAVTETASAPHSASQAPAGVPQTVTFEVAGSPAKVTYGPAGSSIAGKVPMKVTQKLGTPLFYSLEAQLQGGGSVTVKILIDGAAVSRGTASGGYNIAMAEISVNPLTGKWTSDT